MYAQIVQIILPHISDNKPDGFLRVEANEQVHRVEGLSAQEMCHVLLGLPLQEGSRVAQSIDCTRRGRNYKIASNEE